MRTTDYPTRSNLLTFYEEPPITDYPITDYLSLSHLELTILRLIKLLLGIGTVNNKPVGSFF